MSTSSKTSPRATQDVHTTCTDSRNSGKVAMTTLMHANTVAFVQLTECSAERCKSFSIPVQHLGLFDNVDKDRLFDSVSKYVVSNMFHVDGHLLKDLELGEDYNLITRVLLFYYSFPFVEDLNELSQSAVDLGAKNFKQKKPSFDTKFAAMFYQIQKHIHGKVGSHQPPAFSPSSTSSTVHYNNVGYAITGWCANIFSKIAKTSDAASCTFNGLENIVKNGPTSKTIQLCETIEQVSSSTFAHNISHINAFADSTVTRKIMSQNVNWFHNCYNQNHDNTPTGKQLFFGELMGHLFNHPLGYGHTVVDAARLITDPVFEFGAALLSGHGTCNYKDFKDFTTVDHELATKRYERLDVNDIDTANDSDSDSNSDSDDSSGSDTEVAIIKTTSPQQDVVPSGTAEVEDPDVKKHFDFFLDTMNKNLDEYDKKVVAYHNKVKGTLKQMRDDIDELGNDLDLKATEQKDFVQKMKDALVEQSARSTTSLIKIQAGKQLRAVKNTQDSMKRKFEQAFTDQVNLFQKNIQGSFN